MRFCGWTPSWVWRHQMPFRPPARRPSTDAENVLFYAYIKTKGLSLRNYVITWDKLCDKAKNGIGNRFWTHRILHRNCERTLMMVIIIIIIIIIIIAVLVTHFAYASVRLQKCLKMLHEIMFIYLKLLLITVNNNDRETCSDSLNAFNLKLPNWLKTFREPQ